MPSDPLLAPALHDRPQPALRRRVVFVALAVLNLAVWVALAELAVMLT